MKYLVYLLFITVYIGEFAFKKIGLEIKLLSILPEMISIMVGVGVVLYFALYRKIKMQPRYLFFYVAFAVHISIGLIGNHVQPLAVLGGIRTYFKFLPFYFLPMIYDISDKEMRGHLIALLCMALLQFPLALYQRFVEYKGIATGDYIAGTLTSAPILTLFLVCTIAVLIGFYLKKRISTKTFILIAILLFLPTAINETKSTIILLPFAIMMPTIFGVRRESRIKIIAAVLPASILMIISFPYFYKVMYSGRMDVVQFYTTEKVIDYLYKGKEAEQVMGGSETEVHRVDSIIYAYEKNADDFFRLVWGVGIGNAAVSFSKKFQGDYTGEYVRLGGQKTGVAHFIWEIGLLGILYIVWFFLLTFMDALKLRKQNNLSGLISLGWLGVVIVLFIGIPYQNLITKNELMYPFCYLSGFLAARHYVAQREETL